MLLAARAACTASSTLVLQALPKSVQPRSKIIPGFLVHRVTLLVGMLIWRRGQGWGRWRYAVTGGVVVAGYVLMRMLIDPSTMAIAAVDSARTGYLGGLGLPIMLSSGALWYGCGWFCTLAGRIGVSVGWPKY